MTAADSENLLGIVTKSANNTLVHCFQSNEIGGGCSDYVRVNECIISSLPDLFVCVCVCVCESKSSLSSLHSFVLLTSIFISIN